MGGQETNCYIGLSYFRCRLYPFCLGTLPYLPSLGFWASIAYLSPRGPLMRSAGYASHWRRCYADASISTLFVHRLLPSPPNLDSFYLRHRMGGIFPTSCLIIATSFSNRPHCYDSKNQKWPQSLSIGFPSKLFAILRHLVGR